MNANLLLFLFKSLIRVLRRDLAFCFTCRADVNVPQSLFTLHDQLFLALQACLLDHLRQIRCFQVFSCGSTCLIICPR